MSAAGGGGGGGSGDLSPDGAFDMARAILERRAEANRPGGAPMDLAALSAIAQEALAHTTARGASPPDSPQPRRSSSPKAPEIVMEGENTRLEGTLSALVNMESGASGGVQPHHSSPRLLQNTARSVIPLATNDSLPDMSPSMRAFDSGLVLQGVVRSCNLRNASPSGCVVQRMSTSLPPSPLPMDNAALSMTSHPLPPHPTAVISPLPEPTAGDADEHGAVYDQALPGATLTTMYPRGSLWDRSGTAATDPLAADPTALGVAAPPLAMDGVGVDLVGVGALDAIGSDDGSDSVPPTPPAVGSPEDVSPRRCLIHQVRREVRGAIDRIREYQHQQHVAQIQFQHEQQQQQQQLQMDNTAAAPPPALPYGGTGPVEPPSDNAPTLPRTGIPEAVARSVMDEARADGDEGDRGNDHEVDDDDDEKDNGNDSDTHGDMASCVSSEDPTAAVGDASGGGMLGAVGRMFYTFAASVGLARQQQAAAPVSDAAEPTTDAEPAGPQDRPPTPSHSRRASRLSAISAGRTASVRSEGALGSRPASAVAAGAAAGVSEGEVPAPTEDASSSAPTPPPNSPSKVGSVDGGEGTDADAALRAVPTATPTPRQPSMRWERAISTPAPPPLEATPTPTPRPPPLTPEREEAEATLRALQQRLGATLAAAAGGGTYEPSEIPTLLDALSRRGGRLDAHLVSELGRLLRGVLRRDVQTPREADEPPPATVHEARMLSALDAIQATQRQQREDIDELARLTSPPRDARADYDVLQSVLAKIDQLEATRPAGQASARSVLAPATARAQPEPVDVFAAPSGLLTADAAQQRRASAAATAYSNASRTASLFNTDVAAGVPLADPVPVPTPPRADTPSDAAPVERAPTAASLQATTPTRSGGLRAPTVASLYAAAGVSSPAQPQLQPQSSRLTTPRGDGVGGYEGYTPPAPAPVATPVSTVAPPQLAAAVKPHPTVPGRVVPRTTPPAVTSPAGAAVGLRTPDRHSHNSPPPAGLASPRTRPPTSGVFYTPSGKAYYYDDATGKSRWVRTRGDDARVEDARVSPAQKEIMLHIVLGEEGQGRGPGRVGVPPARTL